LVGDVRTIAGFNPLDDSPQVVMDAAFLQSLLPADAGVLITALTVESAGVTVALVTTAATAACPRCRSASTVVHARYRRTLADRPCLGRPVVYAVTARKFLCRRRECPQRVFCERLPELTAPHARTTGELAEAHQQIGLALGGEAGARLTTRLAVPTSPDTLLRRVTDATDEPAPPPRYVGLDDWAIRKGHTYGTILIDLERGTVIDLFPGRDGEALKAWLAAHPQVEVITRDRWPAYIQAATTAAPQATQVADRFHLLVNVREAVEKILSRVAADIRTANTAVNAPTVDPPTTAAAAPSPAAKPLTPTEERRQSRRQGRAERFRRVKELTAEGVSIREIARRLRMGRGAVLRYQRLERCPDWRPGRTGASSVDGFAGFIADWVAAGHRNSKDLHRALQGKGFTGGYDAARRYLNRLIGSTGRRGKRDPNATPTPVERTPPSARKLSFRVANPKVDSHSARVLAALRERNPVVHGALELAEELMGMIRRTTATPLADWVAKAAAGDRDLGNLAKSLGADAAAIQAALTTAWSNGPVEGQVNRLKAIKRSMYGRAGMTLLRARVRHKG
jgi:transposase